MTTFTHDQPARHKVESRTGEILFSRPVELAKAVLPSLVSQEDLTEVGFLDAEDTLSRLNAQAEARIHEGRRVPRRIRRTLSRYANRLLEITDKEPDLLNPHAIGLLAHVSDTTGGRELLETTLEQAYRAGLSTDTDINLQAIEAALERDLPFSEVMRTIGDTLPPLPKLDDDGQPRKPLGDDYDYLFDPSIDRHANVNNYVPTFDEFGQQLPRRELFTDRAQRSKKEASAEPATEAMQRVK